MGFVETAEAIVVGDRTVAFAVAWAGLYLTLRSPHGICFALLQFRLMPCPLLALVGNLIPTQHPNGHRGLSRLSMPSLSL
eukprot:m.83353 g.83353  ORF g.83353 m.83353 type:complete len:80 (+) comp50804_c0_seq28:72-311(+)